MDKRGMVWLAAALLMVIAPAALLFGVDLWRVGAVTIFETMMVFWVAKWQTRQ